MYQNHGKKSAKWRRGFEKKWGKSRHSLDKKSPCTLFRYFDPPA